MDVAQLARHTRVDKLPSVLDFGFARAVEKLVAGNEGTEVLARMYQDDGLYEGGRQAALRLPTFTGNQISAGSRGSFAMRARARATKRC